MKKLARNLSVSVLIACSICLWSACGKSQEPVSQTASAKDYDHDHDAGADHDHDHDSGTAHAKADHTGIPHGGTPVQLGNHGFHLELVNSVDGKMLAYVLDGHMEKEVNVPATSFEIIAKTERQEHRLTFAAVTNAPNATAGKTSVFSAPAAALAKVTSFEGVIPKITLDGKTFENVTFAYPKGTRHCH